MVPILLTGGTGTLGRAVVRRLADGPYEIRVLTRRSAHGGREPFRRMVGDLSTGTGLAAAADGVDTIVHCASTHGRGDIAATQRLVDAAVRTGASPHLIYISIVGVDRIRLSYYQAKLAAERIVIESGLPWTILRATQFHDLVAAIFAWQRWSPVTLTARDLRFQPIDTRDVATRLAELVASGPTGRAPDIGGPDVVPMDELARIYNTTHGRRRPVVHLPMPGTAGAQFAAGHNLAPGNAFGTVTFQRFLAEGGAR